MYDQSERKRFLQERGHEPRTTAWRPDIAANEFEGELPASLYAAGIRRQVRVPSVSLRFEPWDASPAEDQLLFGETFLIYDIDRTAGLAWGTAEHDGHVGFVDVSAFARDVRAPTHWVSVPFARVLPRPDRKAEPIMTLCLNARVTVEAADSADPVYVRIGRDQWVFRGDLRAIGDWFHDPVTPLLPFVNVSSYIWGHRDGLGFDCSGLMQAGWLAMGVPCFRDADQQEDDPCLGHPLGFGPGLGRLQRLDQVYWPGHLAFMVSDTHAIHSMGSEVRRTVIQPITEIDDWRASEYGTRVRTVKRFRP